MVKLEIGTVLYFESFDSSFDWKHVSIQPERRYPFRFLLNVSERQFDLTFRQNSVKVLRGQDVTEENKLYLKIVDIDNNETVIFNDCVVKAIMFKVIDLYVYFNEIILKEENMLGEGDYGGVLEMGVAIE